VNAKDRRFTDREVALVLKRAAELEEHRQSDVPGRGMTLQQLHEIAREVGLGPQLVDSAVAEFESRRRFDTRTLLGLSPIGKVVHALPRVLDRNGMQRLIHEIEDRTSATGTVSEALGSVRWTSTADGHHFTHTTQVSLTPTHSETHVQVTERLSPRLQRVLHLLPPAWGAMIGLAVVASGGFAMAPAVGIVGGGAVLGVGIGRGIWNHLVRRSRARVDDLARAITRESTDLI
jgi:hypothetical protein